MEDLFIGLVRGEISQLFLQFNTLQNLAPSCLFRLTSTVDALHVAAIGPPKIFASLYDDFYLYHIVLIVAGYFKFISFLIRVAIPVPISFDP